MARPAAPFFQQHARYPWDEDFTARLRRHGDLHRDLLRTPGFGVDPREQEWIGGQPLPIWAQVGNIAGLPDVVFVPAFNPEEKRRQEAETVDLVDGTLSLRHFAIEEIPAAYLGKDKICTTPRPECSIPHQAPSTH